MGKIKYKKRRTKYITGTKQLTWLTDTEKASIDKVNEKFVFRSTEYYLNLVDWNDPDDPIRKIVIPKEEELEEWGILDASNESEFTVVPGVEHKYRDTALLLCNDVCAAYCRFCFRQRLFMDENDEVVKDVSEGIEYIKEHPEINNVLLTGGDPLILVTHKLENIVKQLREIDHVKIIRFGSKVPVFDPYRIVDDPTLPEMISRYSKDNKKIYIMAHFNHPRELTDIAIEGMVALQKAGAATVNQTPLIRGVNDNPEVLGELLNKLSYAGIQPYYIFQCRPTLGNKDYSVPIEEGIEIVEAAKARCSGLARRAIFCMSHKTGKVEIIGRFGDQVIFKYHRAADMVNHNRVMVFRSNPEARWLEDYETQRDYENSSALSEKGLEA